MEQIDRELNYFATVGISRALQNRAKDISCESQFKLKLKIFIFRPEQIAIAGTIINNESKESSEFIIQKHENDGEMCFYTLTNPKMDNFGTMSFLFDYLQTEIDQKFTHEEETVH